MADLYYYYFAAWTDSDCLSGCDHKHLTVVSAVVCAQSACAGAYVLAVEDGVLRELNDREQREFQFAMSVDFLRHCPKASIVAFESVQPKAGQFHVGDRSGDIQACQNVTQFFHELAVLSPRVGLFVQVSKAFVPNRTVP
jgi:hypothetical protein